MIKVMNEKLVTKIEKILDYSDIVWPKYGSESVRSLAERIAKKVEEERAKEVSDF